MQKKLIAIVCVEFARSNSKPSFDFGNIKMKRNYNITDIGKFNHSRYDCRVHGKSGYHIKCFALLIFRLRRPNRPKSSASVLRCASVWRKPPRPRRQRRVSWPLKERRNFGYTTNWTSYFAKSILINLFYSSCCSARKPLRNWRKNKNAKLLNVDASSKSVAVDQRMLKLPVKVTLLLFFVWMAFYLFKFDKRTFVNILYTDVIEHHRARLNHYTTSISSSNWSVQRARNQYFL